MREKPAPVITVQFVQVREGKEQVCARDFSKEKGQKQEEKTSLRSFLRVKR